MNKDTDKYVQTAMHLYCDKTGKPLVSVHGDGSVEVNSGVTLDEAATAFWNAVRKVFDQHRTPPAEMELRAIHATAVAAVLTTDKMLTPDVDAWWQHYLRSVLTQPSRTWFTSTSKDDSAADDQPAHWQYLFTYPFDGTAVWRDDSREWNGQRPKAARGLYTRPTPKELQEKLRDAQFAISALAVVRDALGLPAGANLTTDVVQAALDLQIEQVGKANAVIVDLVDQVRDVAGRHRITAGTDPDLHAAIDTADAFVFSRELPTPPEIPPASTGTLPAPRVEPLGYMSPFAIKQLGFGSWAKIYPTKRRPATEAVFAAPALNAAQQKEASTCRTCGHKQHHGSCVNLHPDQEAK